ncbi:ATP-binding cassette domain-containing protein [Virgibacillus proomii]|nr:ATP-binding cassette domain-containing protein [Virgibacillus proomii]
MSDVIHTVNLTKAYGQVLAVNNVDLSVAKGEIYGFLGLNGAGKTTIIRMLLGMATPTIGECYLNGEKVNNLMNIFCLVFIVSFGKLTEFVWVYIIDRIWVYGRNRKFTLNSLSKFKISIVELIIICLRAIYTIYFIKSII